MKRNANGEIAGRPRLAPDWPLPPYSYVPGHAPHPVSHPDGHMAGRREPEDALPLDPERWQECTLYLHGIDLFNHGYYWEAHEAWEALWHAAGRSGSTADFMKALIKLAAAAVKAREGSPIGAARHARRCRELVDMVASHAPYSSTHYAGLPLADVQQLSTDIEAAATSQPSPLAVYDAVLRHV